jgi:hypothetical protein
MRIEITRYGARHWAVFVDGQLLCVTVYRKGALAVRAALRQPGRGASRQTVPTLAIDSIPEADFEDPNCQQD